MSYLLKYKKLDGTSQWWKQVTSWRKEQPTKTEKFEKNLQMYIINLKTLRYKLSALLDIIHSISNYKLILLVSKLRLPKEQKKNKKNFFVLNIFFNSDGILLF